MKNIQTWTFQGHYTESSDAGSRCDIVRAYTEEQAKALAAIEMLEDNGWERDRYEIDGFGNLSVDSLAKIYANEIKIDSEWTDLEGAACPNCTSHVGRPIPAPSAESQDTPLQSLMTKRPLYECGACNYQWIPLGFGNRKDPTSDEIDAEIAAYWHEFAEIESCRTEGCDEDPNDGEGYDGYCGNCADRRDPAEA